MLHDLEKNVKNFIEIEVHLLKANLEKLHLLTNSSQEIQINIDRIAISYSKCENLLDIHTDNKLTSDPHVKSLCKKVSQKLNAFARISYSLKLEQKKLLLNALITSLFSYAPVFWMFHNRKSNNHINPVHGRALRIVYQNHNLTFDELLVNDGSCKIHDCNL